MNACPFLYIWFVPELMKIKQHWQIPVFPTRSICTRKPETAVPRMGGFTDVGPEFVCPPPPLSLTIFRVLGR
jgi:hypothetical protein